MSRTAAIRILFAILAVAFFATPIAARMVGVTAESFENRPFAGAPKPSQGWDAFGQTTRFLTDRMPLRAQAVRANTRIWTDVFGTTPRYGPVQAPGGDQALPFAGAPAAEPAQAPADAAASASAAQVLVGRDGWLFLQGEQDRSCQPFMAFGEALGRWEELAAQIRADGRRVVLAVPPDKGSVYPEQLPDFPGEACAAAGKRRLWSLLSGAEAGTPQRVVALRDDLLAQKPSAGDDLYARKDSHWTTFGSLALVRALVGELGDAGGATPEIRLRPDEIVDPGRAEYTGDLTALLGAPETDTQARREIRRAAQAPRIPGRTVLVGDSYSEAPLPQLTPYFDDLRVLSWVNTPAAQMADEIEQADTVVLETVERELTYRAVTLVPPLLRLLRERG
jgi:alginate O-acetyltransferase complex protein AlgJ